ncbi:MAG: hypothetical protein AAF891_03280 [Pseudomonadota bacterium]
MNRRSFTASLAALFAAPAIPLSASATPAVSSAATARFATAKLIARAHNACSPAMLQRLLRVDGAVAAELDAMLLRNGVITAAGADGMSLAVNPMNTHCVPREALKSTNVRHALAQTKERWQKLARSLEDAAGPEGVPEEAASAEPADEAPQNRHPPADAPIASEHS